MARLFDTCASIFGKKVSGLALAAVIVGGTAFVLGCLSDLRIVAFGALAASWLYFAGLATGAVAFSAAIRSSRGRWAVSALPYAESGAGFFPVAFVLLGVLVLAAAVWMPGAAPTGSAEWISRVVRDLGATGILFLCGTRFLRRAAPADQPPAAPQRIAVAYILIFVATLSMWAIDLVMSLHDWAPSTVIPAFYFMGAFLGAIAWTALVTTSLAPADVPVGTRHDLGKLLFGFIIFWGYLLWAAYLPVWYGNLPDETGQLMARWVGGWKFASLGVLATVLAIPFFSLVPERAKRSRPMLGAIAACILLGLLGERVLLVLPSLTLPATWPAVLVGLAVTAGVGGAFVLTTGARLARQSGVPVQNR